MGKITYNIPELYINKFINQKCLTFSGSKYSNVSLFYIIVNGISLGSHHFLTLNQLDN